MFRRRMVRLTLFCAAMGAGASAETGDALAANTIAATSCEASAVQAAINSAQDGDTVNVPAGTCTWSKAVSVQDKTIVVAGSGSSSTGTVITYGGSGHTLIALDAGSKTGRMELSGFRFEGGDADYWSGMHVQFSGPAHWRNLRIHHNAFVDSGNQCMRGGTATEGLIDHNRFEGATHAIQFDGSGSSDWSGAVAYGTAAFFFVEDNEFVQSDSYGNTGRLAVDLTNGGRVVFRHNTLRNSFFENHDRCRSGLPSARAMEVYGNSFAKDSDGWKAVDLSSGDGVVYDNTFDKNWGIAIGAYQSREGTCQLPAQEEIGAIEPVYTWGNTREGGGSVDEVKCTSSAAGCARMTFVVGQRPGYTPFTYPHPLQGGSSGGGGMTPPAAPTHLTVTP